MTTNLEVISDALRDLNVISEIDTPSAEQGAHGLRKLNEMMEAWTENGIELGYFAQTSATDNCPIPAWAVKGVKTALALEVAPTYGATISPELAKKYDDGFGMIQRKCIVEGMKPASTSHLPQGTGNRGTGYNILTDA